MIRVTREYNMARVLIVDDDVTLRQALTKHLELAGHDVRQAADGDAGVRAYQRHAADLVIVDIFMPVQGGLQTIGRLRREWPGVKILAMSGVKSAGALDVAGHAISLGADRFIGKPFEATELLELVRTLLEERTAPSPDPPR
jgi:DNA-binding response OmpR family regulator